jgi:predicted permease
MFVSGQVAISVLLVALSGLFVRALRHAGLSEPGFEPQGVALTTIDLSMAARMPAVPDEFWRDALERVRRLPGVDTASIARVPPGGWEGIGLGGVDVTDHPGRLLGFSPSWNIVAPGFFATLKIPIYRGRDFSPADTAHSPPVVIIAASLARRCWPGEDAIGRYLTLSTVNPQTSRWEKHAALVVGIVGDIKSSTLIDGFAEPFVYVPVAQTANTDFAKTMTIVTRSRNPGIALHAQIERSIRDIDPDLVAAQAVSLADAIRFGLAPQRALATAAGALGIVGLLLASIGIYGVMAYDVARRRREIGIRLALGAPRAAIAWSIVRHAAWIVGAGTVIGLGLATALGRGLSVFLYGLQAAHAATFLVTVAIVVTVSALACYVPTRRAIGVEPLHALRTE